MSNFVAKTRALMEQMSEAQDKPVDKAHFCATHVEHLLFGAGTCVSEAHAEPDENGHVSWYTVQFADGMRKMPTNELKITMGEEHYHGKKKPMKEDEELEQTNEAQTSAAARLAKAKMSHQSSTTMKHISNPTPGEKAAAKDIKPGIAGYRDRVAMLKSAEARGALKKEDTEVQEANIKHPNQQKLDVHEPEKDELTAKDFEMLRKGKKVEKIVDTEKEMKEEKQLVDVTTTYEMTEQVAIAANPTFQDYLNAVKILVNNDSDEAQREVIALAQEAFDAKEVDILIKAELQAMNEAGAIKMPTSTGMRVMGTRYGNSAEAERNRTKKFIDTMKGPSSAAMAKLEKPAKAKK